MVVKPKIRGFICTTAHPAGCAKAIDEQIEYVQSKGTGKKGPKKVLVIGSSQGFGMATRIVSTFGYDADTLGVLFDKPSIKGRTASAGWYGTAAFEKRAAEKGNYAKSINGDAFSNEIKEQVIETIKKDLGEIDMLVYSLASPRRKDPATGEIFNSTLKTTEKPYENKTIDTQKREILDVKIDPANPKEFEDTIKVMGGEDWTLWIDALKDAGLLSNNFITMAYSYIGPEVTNAMYRSGTIGAAKKHLEKSVEEINAKLQPLNGKAYVSVNKALVTQASSAIPVMPLYISILYKVMKEKGVHEGCIEQIERLYSGHLFGDEVLLDGEGRIRVDDWELREDVQDAVTEIWPHITSENVGELSDIDGYDKEFLKLFGFGIDSVDYDADVEVDVKIPSITE